LKRILVILLGLSLITIKCFAGGPVGGTNTVSGNSEEPKKVAVEFAHDDFSKTSTHWTVGLGLGGNQLVGMVDKDGYGYPSRDYGLSCLLGIDCTWYSGQPTESQIKQALASIKSKNGAMVSEKDLPSLVRDETGINSLNYFEVGTVALLIPANVEFGKMWILSDNVRTRFGFGLPTLISFGINYDIQ
jgi:hypothetical protein